MGIITGKKPPASTPYFAQRRDGARSLTIVCFTRHWLDSFARVKSSWLFKIYGPSERENKGTKQQTGLVTNGHRNGGGGTLRPPPSTQE